METITIHTSKAYEILLEEGLLATAAEHISKVLPPVEDGRAANSAPRKCCVVCDKTVCQLYGQKPHPLLTGLLEAGYTVHVYVFNPGEKSKSLRTAEDLCGFLSENHFGRNDFIIALGGGVCGDLAGFAASIYMRGIPYIQIPTTLLAMADSSVGGKTGVNTDAGKNMLGTFWQPSLVIADPKALETLNKTELLNGLAEVIKAGFIGDTSIFDVISEGLPAAIAKAIQVKKEIVEEDEREGGSRRLLNFGHTIGHAIEKCSNYTIPHGFAVMTGMYLTALAADERGWSRTPMAGFIKSAIDAFAYPVYTDCTAADLAAAAKDDKKHEADRITIIYPDQPGTCAMKELPISDLEVFIASGLTKAQGR
ncbi:MAG: 3-dehydroquinate synthase [Firmicutes bacterium]|nr:3-dehydroquinate synthase [Bacillota bacterium]